MFTTGKPKEGEPGDGALHRLTGWTLFLKRSREAARCREEARKSALRGRSSKVGKRWFMMFALFVAQLGNKHSECDGWARSGECSGNPEFMHAECAKACADVVVDPAGGEMEQCPGWASQGECTRNPKFMMTTCPNNCAEQRAKVVDGLLDESASCIDSADAAASTCVDMHAVPQ